MEQCPIVRQKRLWNALPGHDRPGHLHLGEEGLIQLKTAPAAEYDTQDKATFWEN